jgi:predicted O-methyltransferase YrrM
MDPLITDLLRELEDRTRDRGDAPRLARETGLFLNLMVKATRATRVLHVGAGDGYATLWLADAVGSTGGMVTAIEEDLWAFELARATFARSPHGGRVTLMPGDPAELLAVVEGPFDFVLLDGAKAEALRQLRVVLEQVSSGALICCDKAIRDARLLAEYLAYVHERPGLESLLVPVGDGLEVTYKSP